MAKRKNPDERKGFWRGRDDACERMWDWVTKPAKSNKGGFRRALEHEVDAMRKQMIDDDDMAYGWGSIPLDPCVLCGCYACVCPDWEDSCPQCGVDWMECACADTTHTIPPLQLDAFDALLKQVYGDAAREFLKRKKGDLRKWRS